MELDGDRKVYLKPAIYNFMVRLGFPGPMGKYQKLWPTLIDFKAALANINTREQGQVKRESLEGAASGSEAEADEANEGAGVDEEEQSKARRSWRRYRVLKCRFL
ncbi:hypothetical protein EG329_002881 [Mollisiaceae sp. DMI_Dod_QoI]|nr:hypothetical protein EG329_002881 [Helotiales sp. DMI_Dod_QoI]